MIQAEQRGKPDFSVGEGVINPFLESTYSLPDPPEGSQQDRQYLPKYTSLFVMIPL